MQKHNIPTGKDANIIIRCADPRVDELLNDASVREKLGLGKTTSQISDTGSIGYYFNENQMDKLYKQLDILAGHFHPEKIVIINHTDCGYYKSLGRDNEESYLEDVDRAIELIAKRFPKDKYPDLKIEGYLLDTETGNLTPVKQLALV